jgi:N-acetylglucosaminyldiphosphoundecaprenol N-acetyl-beta-D-mannosaminyltransferase
MLHTCELAPLRNYRIFILGAPEEVNAAAVEELRRRFPGINIVGRANGYFEPRANSDLVRRINDSATDILFVALGSPRQERWIEANLPHLNVRVCQGIGGTLDTIVGTAKRAPHAWQALGLEWAYRLLSQPSRAKRQLKLLAFVFEVLSLKFSGGTA